jgi:hypothetical protein
MTDTSTTTWTSDELARLGGGDEIDISTRRIDGSLRPSVPIWIVAVDGVLYVRSYRGTDGAWYRHATIRPEGAIKINGPDDDAERTGRRIDPELTPRR